MSLSTKHTRSCAAHDHIVLKCAYPKRVQREKEVLQRFEGHASIRQLLDFAENPPCLVLEHLQVDALRSATKAPISRQNIKTIARSILSALESLHANGIIHTDIKPDNILLNYGQEGTTVVEAKLADYAHVVIQQAMHTKLILPGIPMAPRMSSAPAFFEAQKSYWACICLLQQIYGPSAPRFVVLSMHPPAALGSNLISLLWGRGFHIFKPVAGVTADDAEFPAHVLMEQARYFGPFPLRYQELLDEESESILAAIHVLIEQEGTRKPFLLVEDEEIQLEDKEFLCDIMRLDPLERPTASDLLKHRWFDVL
ncbi:hypothetical protein D0869_02269 [Hortaea werneckii]|uniref:Autophagy-related protein 1 n=1 Tax=Hortaea werneckii TaxID=91943 RepID=A0A3M6X9N3_HORWE|nr:hypothetical protein D0869_02269 [Hortaea werneckii]